jgi:hypothetical protein
MKLPFPIFIRWLFLIRWGFLIPDRPGHVYDYNFD